MGHLYRIRRANIRTTGAASRPVSSRTLTPPVEDCSHPFPTVFMPYTSAAKRSYTQTLQYPFYLLRGLRWRPLSRSRKWPQSPSVAHSLGAGPRCVVGSLGLDSVSVSLPFILSRRSPVKSFSSSSPSPRTTSGSGSSSSTRLSIDLKAKLPFRLTSNSIQKQSFQYSSATPRSGLQPPSYSGSPSCSSWSTRQLGFIVRAYRSSSPLRA